MTTLLSVMLFLLTVYLIAGGVVVTQFPLRHSSSKIRSVFLWGWIYRRHGWLFQSYLDPEKAVIVQAYLDERWDYLIERVPIWTTPTGQKVQLFLVLKTKIGPKSMEWPPFLGHQSNDKEGRRRIEDLAKTLSRHPVGPESTAIWVIQTRYGTIDVGPGQIISSVQTGTKSWKVSDVVYTKEDLKSLVPW